MKTTFFFLLLLFTTTAINSQDFYTRTAHINVRSSNKVMDVVGDNYQVNSTLNSTNGELNFIGLIKSFEFKLGALDRIFNSKRINVTEFPKITYNGEVTNIQSVNFNRPGTYPVSVKGMLYIWDEKRITPAEGTLTVHEDGSISGKSSFSIIIEDKNVEKVNRLMREKLPAILDLNVEKLGISKEIQIKADMKYVRKS